MYAWSKEDIGKTFQISEAVISKGIKGWKFKRQKFYIMSRVRKLQECSVPAV